MITLIQGNLSSLYARQTMVFGEGCNTKKVAKIFHFAKCWEALSWGITAVGIVKQRVASLFLITRSILFWLAWKMFGERPMFTDVITTRTLSLRIAYLWFWDSR